MTVKQYNNALHLILNNFLLLLLLLFCPSRSQMKTGSASLADSRVDVVSFSQTRVKLTQLLTTGSSDLTEGKSQEYIDQAARKKLSC